MKKFEDLMSVKNEIENITASEAKEKLNDPSTPFGHGYIVAATIAGYKPEDYLN